VGGVVERVAVLPAERRVQRRPGGGGAPGGSDPIVPGRAPAIVVAELDLFLSHRLAMSTCLIPEHGGAGREQVAGSIKLCLNRVDLDEKDAVNAIVGKAFEAGSIDDAMMPAYAASHPVPPEAPLPTPQAVVVFACNARGEEFHRDQNNAESGAVLDAVPGAAMAGCFVAGEYGPGPTQAGYGEGASGYGPAANEYHSFGCALAIIGSLIE
jgi:hypothetical protein